MAMGGVNHSFRCAMAWTAAVGRVRAAASRRCCEKDGGASPRKLCFFGKNRSEGPARLSDALLATLALIALLQIKHVIADFVLQSPYIIQNRRFYGHPGGILHVAIHAAGSLAALAIMGLPGLVATLALLLAEAVVHYHIDWSKDNLVARAGLTPRDAGFWYATGIDQGLHQLTYLAMAAYWVQGQPV